MVQLRSVVVSLYVLFNGNISSRGQRKLYKAAVLPLDVTSTRQRDIAHTLLFRRQAPYYKVFTARENVQLCFSPAVSSESYLFNGVPLVNDVHSA